jgi:hypothetical protein
MCSPNPWDSPIQPLDLFAIAPRLDKPLWCAEVIAHHHESKVYTDLKVVSPWGRMRGGQGLDPARFTIRLWREIKDVYLRALARSNEKAKDNQNAKARKFLLAMKELGYR